MRFQNDRPPARWLNRRDQLTLMRLVGLLTVVIIVIQVVAQPDFWWWMFPGEATQQTASDAEQDEAELRRKMDFRVRRDEEEPLPPGVFRSPRSAPTGVPSTTSREIPAAGEPVNVVLPDSLLQNVRDNTIGIRRDESDAFYAVLARAEQTPLSYLERAARDNLSFARLMVDSDSLRGTLVTIEGELKRLLPVEAVSNPHGIEQFHEAWLINANSSPNLYRLVFTEIPEGIPTGENLEESVPVRFSGYFFKREGYASRGGMHTAPLLIGRRPRWFPPRDALSEPDDIQLAAPWIVGGIMAIAGILAISVWRFTMRDKSFKRGPMKRIMAAPADDVAALQKFEIVDPGEMLRQLELESATDADEPAPAEADAPAGPPDADER